MNAYSRFILIFYFLSLTSRVFAAPHCAVPEVSVQPALAMGDADASISRPLVAAIIQVAEAERDSNSFYFTGLRVLEAVVPLEVYDLAVRLRQLECARLAGRVVDPRPLYENILRDAHAVEGTAGGPPVSPAEVRLALEPWHKPTSNGAVSPDFARRQARGYWAFGGAVTGLGALLLAGTIVQAIHTASYQSPPACQPNEFLCLNGLNDGFHVVDVVGSAALGIGAGVALTTGIVLLAKGHGWAERTHPTPLVSADARGGSVGMQLRF